MNLTAEMAESDDVMSSCFPRSPFSPTGLFVSYAHRAWCPLRTRVLGILPKMLDPQIIS